MLNEKRYLPVATCNESKKFSPLRSGAVNILVEPLDWLTKVTPSTITGRPLSLSFFVKASIETISALATKQKVEDFLVKEHRKPT